MSSGSASYAYKTKMSTYWSLSAKLLQQVFSLAATLYVARLLGPKEFGVMAIGMAVVVYLNSLTSFGMTGAIVNKKNIDETQIHSLFTLNLLLSVVLVIICISVPGPIAAMLNAPDLAKIIPTLSLIVLLATFYNLPMALLRREMKFKAHAAIDFLQYIIVGIIMVALAISGFGIWALVYAQVGGYLLSSIVLLMFTGWRPRFSLKLSSLRGLYDYGTWEMVRYNLNYLEGYASYFVVCNSINATMLGLYDRAASFATLPDRIVRIQITAVLFSAFSRINHDRARLISAFYKSLIVYALIVIPTMLAIAIVSDDFVTMVLGGKWVAMIPTMQILCIAGMFKMMSAYFRNFNISNSSYKKQSIFDAVVVGLGILMCIWGVQYGIKGVALAVLMSSLLALSVNISLTRHSFAVVMGDIWAAILPGAIGGILMAVAMLLAKTLLIENLIALIVAQLLSGAVTLVLWSAMCPFTSARNTIRELFLA